MTKLLSRFYKDESGATAVEYGLIATLIAVAIMVGATQLGSALNDRFSGLATSVKGAGGGGGDSHALSRQDRGRLRAAPFAWRQRFPAMEMPPAGPISTRCGHVTLSSRERPPSEPCWPGCWLRQYRRYPPRSLTRFPSIADRALPRKTWMPCRTACCASSSSRNSSNTGSRSAIRCRSFAPSVRKYRA
jgi:pilus assembly protein Flp/PilA